MFLDPMYRDDSLEARLATFTSVRSALVSTNGGHSRS